MNDILTNYTRALKLYVEGIRLQMEYEIKCEDDSEDEPSEEDLHTLEMIRDDTVKLYEVMKKFRREM